MLQFGLAETVAVVFPTPLSVTLNTSEIGTPLPVELEVTVTVPVPDVLVPETCTSSLQLLVHPVLHKRGVFISSISKQGFITGVGKLIVTVVLLLTFPQS